MAKVSYMQCSFFHVADTDFNCPMCGAKVPSRTKHECVTEIEAAKAAVRRLTGDAGMEVINVKKATA